MHSAEVVELERKEGEECDMTIAKARWIYHCERESRWT
jgi:hypothetical protein